MPVLELLWQAFPVELGGLQHAEGAHDVGLRESEGVLDAAVHMALGCEMNDAVDVFILHELQHALEVADVHADEHIVRTILNILQVGEVAGIGQLVEVNNLVLGVLMDK